MKLSKEFKIGLFAVVACTTFYLGFNFLKGIDFFSSSKTYYAFYNHVDGLAVGNPVWVHGFVVGRVDAIQLMQEENNRLRVAIHVRSDIEVGKDSKAVLASTGVLGEKKILLELGLSEQILKDKDTISSLVSRGMAEELKEKAYPIMVKLDSSVAAVNALLAIINDNREKMDNTFTYVQDATHEAALLMQHSRKNLETVTANLALLTGDLNSESEGLKGLLARLNAVADSLQHSEIKQLIAQANSSMAKVDQSLTKINEGTGTLGKLVNDDSLYTNLNQSAYSLDLLLTDLREQPKRYVHFSLFGKKQK
ncbi:MAG: MCE family protein [Cytophagales bacterium]|nr:MCE family protein [Cytophagales bacterium]